MMKKCLSIILLIIIPLTVFSQKNETTITFDKEDLKGSINKLIDEIGDLANNNPRTLKPLSVNAGIEYDFGCEDGNICTSIGYFFFPQLEAEFTLGSNFSERFYLATGAKLHFSSKRNSSPFTPFTGLLAGSDYGDIFVQLPVGVNVATNFGLNFSASINQHIWFSGGGFISGDLRIGWRF